ncbi:alpha/beta fold hydrolase [Neiella holothuriorum]|uniref:alpha/beta fold hydrolase n=1 Tax=Neiella holothuriorum TaxID=2870530 RepID=UPI001CED3993|nr:alpha/beta fold hydrolase [Neiella holothuriorum]
MANKSFARILLAHGAGAGSDSEFMQQLANALNHHGVAPILFDFPYMVKAKALQKRRPPDRMPILLKAMTDQAAQLPSDLPLVLAGKSMGGRVATMLLDELGVPGIAYGYPFHPLGKPENLRVEHLQTINQPLLVLQGERDGFGKPEEVAGYSLPTNVEVCWLADGDHSFKPRKASGYSQLEHIEFAAKRSAQFIQEHLC